MSIQSNIFQMVSKNTIKKYGLNQEQTINHLRFVFNNTPSITLLPKGVRIQRINTPEFRGERVAVKNPEMVMLYFHGGGYVGGRTKTYHNFASRLAKKLNAEVFLATYPFAPENPYPAAPNRCLQAYKYLLAQGKGASNIVIAGDSAGGGLTLATLLQIRDCGLPTPKCAITISPGACCFPDQQLIERKCKSDAMLTVDYVKSILNAYIPNEEDRHHPYASPAKADFKGLPPIMITVSKEEILYGDAVKVRGRAEEAGIDVEWLERPGVFHVWPIMVPFVPEANRDLNKITRFIERYH